jgi:hypothetical protein
MDGDVPEPSPARESDYSGKVLLVVCWIAVASFAVFAIFTLATGSDVSALLMIASGFIWLGCGVAYIGIRRSR